jgi:acetyl esterase
MNRHGRYSEVRAERSRADVMRFDWNQERVGLTWRVSRLRQSEKGKQYSATQAFRFSFSWLLPFSFQQRWLVLVPLWIGINVGVLLTNGTERQLEAQERDPLTEPLQSLLKLFPDADMNRDGTLSREEATAYRQKLLAQRQTSNVGRARNGVPAPTQADVKYGPYERNVLDFYQATRDRPTPLIVYIHGGGFVAGDKDSLHPELTKQALAAGISCASINYRFVDGKKTLFPAPQRDGARAIQFLRSKADEWNIDPARIGCYGGSAGAGISMWIGFHDELAKPDSDDPVLRQSSRIQAVGTLGGQSTYDPIEIKELIGGRAWEHPSILKVYGLKSFAEALQPTAAMKELYDECSAIRHLTADDPPLYMVYNEPDGPLPANAKPGQGIHHPNFGRHLQERMNELSLENIFVYAPTDVNRDIVKEMLTFFRKHLDQP